MINWVWEDSPFMVIAPLLFAIVFGLISLSIELDIWPHNQGMSVSRLILVVLPLILLVISSSVTAILFLGTSFFHSLLSENVKVCAALTGIALIFSCVFAGMFASSNKAWEWIFLLYGFLIVVGIVAFIAAIGCVCFLLAPTSTTGKVIRAYLGSFKNWACPLVKAPWEASLPETKEEKS
jgi:hypothetical protein